VTKIRIKEGEAAAEEKEANKSIFSFYLFLQIVGAVLF
jgi:hypothetical protein